MNLSFQTLGKTVDVEFDSASQHIVVYFGGVQIGEVWGDVLDYPADIQLGLIRGAAAISWERKKLREIAEEILSDELCN